MTSFPKLSYECPIRWDTMRGDDRERYCAKCARSVVNISLLTLTEREALLANPPPGDLCVAYYQRLSGEYVSAESPLTPAESRRVVQWGAIAASAATLAAAAHFAPEMASSLTAPGGPVEQFCTASKSARSVAIILGQPCRPPSTPPAPAAPSPPPTLGPKKPATPPKLGPSPKPNTPAKPPPATPLPADKTI